MLGSQSPEARVTQRVGKVWQVHGCLSIPFASTGQDRVGAAFDLPGDASGEMHSKEGKGRIRYWVDEVLAEVLCLPGQGVVLATKGNDSHVWRCSKAASESVRLEPAAVDHLSSPNGPPGGVDHEVIRFSQKAKYLKDEYEVPDEEYLRWWGNE